MIYYLAKLIFVCRPEIFTFESEMFKLLFVHNFFSAAGGEIFNLCLPDLEETIHETDIIRLVRQILEGISHLHQNNIVHLDLKVI